MDPGFRFHLAVARLVCGLAGILFSLYDDATVKKILNISDDGIDFESQRVGGSSI